MSAIIACGLNHKTAPLPIRERLAFDPTETDACLHYIVERDVAKEVAILSTCNRTEIYCRAEHSQPLIDWLGQNRTLPAAQLQPHLYCHQGQNAVQHMLRVANGLDSMVLGEPQILGQMKKAFAQANERGTLGPHLHKLSQHIFSVSKQIRTNTNIGTNSVSIAYLAVNLAKRIFADLQQRRALLIGAGETIELVAKYLHTHNIQTLFVANRTLSKAQHIAAQYQGQAITLHDVPKYLPQADIVISATKSSLPILGKGSIESALKTRKHNPMLMLDIAVPRDIEAEVGQLNDVYLYTIDDLQQMAQDNLHDREVAAQQAEQIILTQTNEFMRWRETLANIDIARTYRDVAIEMRDQTLAKQLDALRNGEAAEVVLNRLAHQLTNKLLHQPTIHIKQHTPDNKSEILALARKLFSIE